VSLANLSAWGGSVGLELSEDQLSAFSNYEAGLYETNEVMNLTRVPREECWLRHFVDSLLFQDLIPEGARVLDIGTGPGLPAWPLACARPDLRVTALDSNTKMLGFLREHPLPNLEVALARAEEWGVREQFDVVTGRALAPLPLQLELSAAPCVRGGWVMPMRTASDDFDAVDLGPLGLSLKEVVHRELPGTGIVRALPRYEKASATRNGFPRRWPEMKKKPLVRG